MNKINFKKNIISISTALTLVLSPTVSAERETKKKQIDEIILQGHTITPKESEWWETTEIKTDNKSSLEISNLTIDSLNSYLRMLKARDYKYVNIYGIEYREVKDDKYGLNNNPRRETPEDIVENCFKEIWLDVSVRDIEKILINLDENTKKALVSAISYLQEKLNYDFKKANLEVVELASFEKLEYPWVKEEEVPLYEIYGDKNFQNNIETIRQFIKKLNKVEAESIIFTNKEDSLTDIFYTILMIAAISFILAAIAEKELRVCINFIKRKIKTAS